MNIRKYTYEDRFARKFWCNPQRFVKKMKKINRKKFRRIVKRGIDTED